MHARAFPLAAWNFSYQKSLSSFFTWANNPCKEQPTDSTSFGLKDANNKSTVKSWCDLQLKKTAHSGTKCQKKKLQYFNFLPFKLFGIKVVAYFFHKGKSLVCATTYRNNNIWGPYVSLKNTYTSTKSLVQCTAHINTYTSTKSLVQCTAHICMHEGLLWKGQPSFNYFQHPTCQPGRNDNQVGKLLGEKMVDEIDSLFPCLGICLVKNFAIPMLVVLHQCCNTHFQGAQ